MHLFILGVMLRLELDNLRKSFARVLDAGFRRAEGGGIGYVGGNGRDGRALPEGAGGYGVFGPELGHDFLLFCFLGLFFIVCRLVVGLGFGSHETK